MKIFCLADFKVAFEKLQSNKSYRSIESEVIGYFFGKSVQELSSGTLLNNSSETPYIKKRLGGRGGFRVYFLLIIKDESAFLMYLHPKTGSLGYENVTDDSKAYLYKKVLECIKSKELYRLSLDKVGEKIVFEKVSQ
jgi:hypothetical protein